MIFILLFFTACKSTQRKERDRENIVAEGATVFSKYGCMVCHSLDGTELYGPALDNIYMKEIRVERDGNEITVTADRDYIRKAITDPRHEKVLEYKEKEMPMTFLNDEEIEILVEYIVESNKKDNKTELP